MVSLESITNILTQLSSKKNPHVKPADIIKNKSQYFKYMYSKLEIEGMKRYRMKQYFPNI